MLRFIILPLYPWDTTPGNTIMLHSYEALCQLLGYAGFVLPKGYPDTVTPDYLPFQLWAVPAHITGWVGTSLATSSLLKAVGVANSAAGTAAATAAIKWITKDGIGAAGRSLVSSVATVKETLLNVCSWIL